MAASPNTEPAWTIHPVFAFLLAAAVPLFLGAFISDIAFANTAEPQWNNFAQWLIPGGMVFTGFSLLWALVAVVRVRARLGRPLLCLVLLLATFALGLVDSLVHSIDAYGIMPGAPVYSALLTLLALLATIVGFSRLRAGAAR